MFLIVGVVEFEERERFEFGKEISVLGIAVT